MTITGFKCVGEMSDKINCDAHGNNAAISCPVCGHPILFVARENQKGSDALHATKCRGCEKSFFIEIYKEKRLIKLYGETKL